MKIKASLRLLFGIFLRLHRLNIGSKIVAMAGCLNYFKNEYEMPQSGSINLLRGIFTPFCHILSNDF